MLNQFSSTTNNNQKSDKLVYYNENTQLNEIIQTKNNLNNELGEQRLQLINFDEVIKKNSSALNVKNSKGLNTRLKFILPIIFIFIFILLNSFIAFYKKQTLKLVLK